VCGSAMWHDREMTSSYTCIFHICTPSSFLSIMSSSLGRPDPATMLKIAELPAKVLP